MKVTSTHSVDFPKLNWAINAGETKELPTNKDAAERILADPFIRPVDGAKPEPVKEKSK